MSAACQRQLCRKLEHRQQQKKVEIELLLINLLLILIITIQDAIIESTDISGTSRIKPAYKLGNFISLAA